jgi:hypothetical protein
MFYIAIYCFKIYQISKSEITSNSKMSGPLETAVSIINPDDYDVIISDVRDVDFEAIGEEVGYTRHASFTANNLPPTVRDVMWGPSLRAFIPLLIT